MNAVIKILKRDPQAKSNSIHARLNLSYLVFSVSFQVFCLLSNFVGLIFLFFLLFEISYKGLSQLDLNFLQNYPSRFPERAGLYSALVGSAFMMFLTALFAIPISIGTAIYLEEYTRASRWVRFVKLNIQNLAGVPSIIYGILGLTIFVRGLNLERSLLSGSLTVALLVMPIITIASQEALRAVPRKLRFAGYSVGMTRWQVIRQLTLAQAMPGILTGTILALSRAVGETAPLIMIGALTYVAFVPHSLFDSFTAIPIQIHMWVSRPQKEFHDLASAGSLVLLILLLLMNTAALFMRIHYRRKSRFK